MLRFILGTLVIFVAGCASSYNASRFIGRDIQDVVIAEGPPAHVFPMNDGRTGYQWVIGGDTALYWPGETHSFTTAHGSATASTFTSSAPGVVETLPGCPVTFIVGQDGIVDDWRSPCDDR